MEVSKEARALPSMLSNKQPEIVTRFEVFFCLRTRLGKVTKENFHNSYQETIWIFRWERRKDISPKRR